eukprot:Trichotokara_eunicae@DN3461_c0_g1_i1.p1
MRPILTSASIAQRVAPSIYALKEFNEEEFPSLRKIGIIFSPKKSPSIWRQFIASVNVSNASRFAPDVPLFRSNTNQTAGDEFQISFFCGTRKMRVNIERNFLTKKALSGFFFPRSAPPDASEGLVEKTSFENLQK